jgi:hypothetical protein
MRESRGRFFEAREHLADDALHALGRPILAVVIDKGVLTSESSRAPLHLAFPVSLAHRWMPGLLPARID